MSFVTLVFTSGLYFFTCCPVSRCTARAPAPASLSRLLHLQRLPRQAGVDLSPAIKTALKEIRDELRSDLRTVSDRLKAVPPSPLGSLALPEEVRARALRAAQTALSQP